MRAWMVVTAVLVACGDDGGRGVTAPATCDGFVRTWCQEHFACVVPDDFCDGASGKCILGFGRWHEDEGVPDRWWVFNADDLTPETCEQDLLSGSLVISATADPFPTLACVEGVDYAGCIRQARALTCEATDTGWVQRDGPWGALLSECMPGPVEHDNAVDEF